MNQATTNLTNVQADYPLFVLGGVIVDSDHEERIIKPRMRQFKSELLGREDVCLHTADIARNRNGFERLIYRQFRQRFYDELNRMMRELEYKVVACAIRKDRHLARYGVGAIDPYLLSLNFLVERFCFEIGNVDNGGLIFAEKRNPILDRGLDIAWLNLKVQGTDRIKAAKLNRRIVDLRTLSKDSSVAGLQLADLVVTPIGRHTMGKNRNQDWTIVESKFRRRGGTYHGHGLVVLPQ